jgi:hypothetical protein
MAGTSDDGWEDGAWGVISGKSGLAHTGSVVNNESLNFFLRHYVRVLKIKARVGEERL